MICTVDGSYTAGTRAKLTKGEVKRVQRLADDLEHWCAILSAYSLAECMFFRIRPNDEGDRDAAAIFWENEGIDIDDEDCLEAWCYGAAGYGSPE